jgi:hypothetical protein
MDTQAALISLRRVRIGGVNHVAELQEGTEPALVVREFFSVSFLPCSSNSLSWRTSTIGAMVGYVDQVRFFRALQSPLPDRKYSPFGSGRVQPIGYPELYGNVLAGRRPGTKRYLASPECGRMPLAPSFLGQGDGIIRARQTEPEIFPPRSRRKGRRVGFEGVFQDVHAALVAFSVTSCA